LVDAIVPFHVPAMFVVVLADTPDGAVELPPHAEALATRQMTSTRRIVPSIPANFVAPLTVL
jgi:hypothetical protein